MLFSDMKKMHLVTAGNEANQTQQQVPFTLVLDNTALRSGAVSL